MKIEGKFGQWLAAPELQRVFDALETAGGEARVAGGAVRNSLMELPVSDVDLSTTLFPDETIKALEVAGLKAVPTGYEHGTVTAVGEGAHFEITTLREDIETDGRHAVVRFGTDWKKDAARRDLTMNALYCDRHGVVHDPLGGLPDLEARIVRFIGNAEERIEEDFLRILRFFRFFASYGSGRPDGEGLKACAKLKGGLEHVSVERIWQELYKILGANDPSRALLWMRTTGVLSAVLPQSDKWGIDLIPALIRAEQAYGWDADGIIRLEAIIRPDGENVVALARGLKLPNALADRLTAWAMEAPVDAKQSEADFQKRLYFGSVSGIADRLKLQTASAVEKGDEAISEALVRKITLADAWQKPKFPVSGKDLLQLGHAPGEGLGETLKILENRWVDSGFALTSEELLASLPKQ